MAALLPSGAVNTHIAHFYALVIALAQGTAPQDDPGWRSQQGVQPQRRRLPALGNRQRQADRYVLGWCSGDASFLQLHRPPPPSKVLLVNTVTCLPHSALHDLPVCCNRMQASTQPATSARRTGSCPGCALTSSPQALAPLSTALFYLHLSLQRLFIVCLLSCLYNVCAPFYPCPAIVCAYSSIAEPLTTVSTAISKLVYVQQ